MRLPVRSESDAFRIVMRFALLTGASLALGVLTEAVWGIALYAAGVTAGLVVELFGRDKVRREPLRDAVAAPHPGATPGRWHVLVVADEALEGTELRDEIRKRSHKTPELDILAPVLVAPTHLAMSDVDREAEEARSRLKRALAWAHDQGIDARGEIGDPGDPMSSLEDELRRFGADEVIIATHPRDRSNWLEPRMVERLRAQLDIPVTQVVVDEQGHRVEVESP